LQDDEEKFCIPLFQIWESETCVAKKHCMMWVSHVTNLSTDEFSKQTIALWSHGLISFNSVTLPILSDLQSSETIPCIEIHELLLILVDEMPYI